MEFSSAKCKTLHFGLGQAPDLAVEREHGRHVTELVNSFKELGVIRRSDLKRRDQIDTAMAKA